MDEIYEQHLIRKAEKRDKLLIYLRNMCFLFFVFYGILMSFGVAVIFLAIWLFLFIVCRNVFVDYDYEYCCGEIVISKIILKKRRKIIATLQINQFKGLYQLSECHKIIHASIYKNETETYVFQTLAGEIGFVLSLNERMKKLIMKGV